jgi:GTP-binding protein
VKRGTVAIIGRPNVGKSTLFNRIVGGRRAIVDDRPGVTRDRNFAEASWNGKSFWLVDTGGWIVDRNDPVTAAIRTQIEIAIAEADVIVFVVDTQEGVHPADQEVAVLVRKCRDRVVVAANKADELAGDISHHAFHELGLGDPQPVSASTGKGSGDLLDCIVALLPETPDDDQADVINVAVVGRPNVGKSSLVNRLLGQERLVVSPIPGTTRDAIDTPLRYHGKTLNFIDTAGLRKRSKVEDEIEFYSTLRSKKALQRADVSVLVVDAVNGIHTQDLRIAQEAWDLGSALILAVNKWDAVEEKETMTAQRGETSIKERVPFLGYVPFIYISATTGQRVRELPDAILAAAATREHRVSTAELNQGVSKLVDAHQPPQVGGREVKLLYTTQIGVRPPTIAIISNHPDDIPESYRRYLERGIRARWGFVGTPIRLKFRMKRRRA